MCIQCLCCPYSSASESFSATNPINRRIGASVIMNCVEPIFFCISWWLHPRNGERPYERNWIWNLQTQPKNLRLSEGPQNHETSCLYVLSIVLLSTVLRFYTNTLYIYIYIYMYTCVYIYGRRTNLILQSPPSSILRFSRF